MTAMGVMGAMGMMARMMMVRKHMIETNNHKGYPQDDDTTRDEPIQVLVVDDQYAFTDMLRLVLNLQPDINVVGTALTGDEGLRVALETHPDVALVDYHMPIMSGLDVIKGLKSARELTRVIVLTGDTDEALMANAIAEGAAGYITKHQA